MKKYILTAALFALICGTASAQGILGRLGERAKQAVENNVGNKIEKGVNDLLDGKKKDKKDIALISLYLALCNVEVRQLFNKDGVAHYGHLTGAVCGVLFGFICQNQNLIDIIIFL